MGKGLLKVVRPYYGVALSTHPISAPVEGEARRIKEQWEQKLEVELGETTLLGPLQDALSTLSLVEISMVEGLTPPPKEVFSFLHHLFGAAKAWILSHYIGNPNEVAEKRLKDGVELISQVCPHAEKLNLASTLEVGLNLLKDGMVRVHSISVSKKELEAIGDRLAEGKSFSWRGVKVPPEVYGAPYVWLVFVVEGLEDLGDALLLEMKRWEHSLRTFKKWVEEHRDVLSALRGSA